MINILVRSNEFNDILFCNSPVEQIPIIIKKSICNILFIFNRIIISLLNLKCDHSLNDIRSEIQLQKKIKYQYEIDCNIELHLPLFRIEFYLLLEYKKSKILPMRRESFSFEFKIFILMQEFF